MKCNPPIWRFSEYSHVWRAQLEAFVNAATRKALITILIVVAAALFIPELLLGEPGSALPTETTVAFQRTKDLIISITNSDGRLKGGENSFCVVFQNRGTLRPLDVLDASIEFTFLSGRIYGKPIKGKVTKVETGRYCGQVSLGNQYHRPASYYALVCYRIGAGKARKQRLFLSVR